MSNSDSSDHPTPDGTVTAATADPNARHAKTHCIRCDSDISAAAKICTSCKCIQKPARYCHICAEPMASDSVRCSACQAYRGWRRFLPASSTIALMTALVSVITSGVTAVNYMRDRDSHTSFIVADVSATAITISAWNTGNKPAALVSYLLLLDDTPLATLEPVAADAPKTAISAREKVTIVLKPSGFNGEAIALLSSNSPTASVPKTPTLLIEIEESNGTHRKLEAPLSRDRVRLFITSNSGGEP